MRPVVTFRYGADEMAKMALACLSCVLGFVMLTQNIACKVFEAGTRTRRC
jgi:hypothetical protein